MSECIEKLILAKEAMIVAAHFMNVELKEDWKEHATQMLGAANMIDNWIDGIKND